MTNPNEHIIPATMRAVLTTGYGGLDKLVYRDDVPTPRPAADEVLIAVGACGMNNTDINLRSRWYDRTVDTDLSLDVGVSGVGQGDRPDTATEASWNTQTVSFPRIQGAAVAGRIVAVGADVDATRMGERVVVDPQIRNVTMPPRAQLVAYLGGDRDGGFAEYVSVPAANAHTIETDLTDAELATFPTSYDTAEEMLERARLARGETVVVTGAAGGVGTALIQLAILRGARVIAIAGAEKEERLRTLGAHDFVARETPDANAAISAIVGENAVNVVADVVGGPIFGHLIKMLCRGGRYATAGAIAGPVQPFDLRDLIYKDLEMYGITCPTEETFKRIIDHVRSGRLRPLLDETFGLKDLRDAQTAFLKRTHVGKFAVIP
jgi:NADPH:quinone reductase-like Zn-dependent oxidoreductase